MLADFLGVSLLRISYSRGNVFPVYRRFFMTLVLII